MSDDEMVKIPTWYLESGRAKANDAHVLVCISSFSDDDQNSACSLQAISHLARLSVKTVRASVQNLIDVGVLQLGEHPGHYRLIYDKEAVSHE